MAQFYTLLTQVGQAKLANAIALGETIVITHIAVGDGGGSLPTPDSDRTSLVNEQRRAQINRVEVDDENPNWIVVEQVLPPDVGGWTIREIGIYDEDEDLIGYGNYPETYKPTLDEGSGRTQTVRFVLQVSDTAAVTLKVDPSVVLATRQYVDDQRAAHEQSRNHPESTEAEQGMARIADQDTVNTGDNDTRFVTAKKLKAWGVQWVKQATETIAGMLKVATQSQVDAGENDETAITPKKLRWGVDYSIGDNGYIVFPSWLGGLILQWGSASAGGDTGTVNDFSIEFPEACLRVFCNDVDTGNFSIIIAAPEDYTTTGFAAYSQRINGNFGGESIHYFAIGH
ncbi:MAG: phage tail protein [Pseudomonadota bacterium]